FDVIAMEADEFDLWLTELARPASPGGGEGRELFEQYGCNGCHAVRGHFAGSPIGPDLTRFGARLSLAAGALPMTRDAVSRFIRNPAAFKPGALMPPFERMSTADANAIADYLAALE